MNNKATEQLKFINDLKDVIEEFEDSLNDQEIALEQAVDDIFELVYNYLEKNDK